ncbi:hypothetical protein L6164_019958 [Bauhinia variegata]|uniref:Uncharacterized protein n=1 Tax=Bauhinia variegata TaxID=167791 RepID=A0ACB9MTG8_BAUVA|nr:hypothetical protein L6164_019958 [Bauhinia variegata]
MEMYVYVSGKQSWVAVIVNQNLELLGGPKKQSSSPSSPMAMASSSSLTALLLIRSLVITDNASPSPYSPPYLHTWNSITSLSLFLSFWTFLLDDDSLFPHEPLGRNFACYS